MEQVHGVDVSWMTQATPKDRINRRPPSPPAKIATPARPQQITTTATSSPKPASPNPQNHGANNGHATSPAIPITRRHSRSGSLDKSNPGSPTGTPPSRRNSWFSNISAKFSGTNLHLLHQQQQPQQQQQPASPHSPSQPQHGQVTEPPQEKANDSMPESSPSTHPPVPRPSGSRGAVLPPATKPIDNGPYTPAPPKSGQAGFLGVFRRLSSSGNGHAAARVGNGLVERRILNVDDKRQRCAISELKDNKLKKVSFCVDVEVAPVPKYADAPDPADRVPVDSTHKTMTEKGEGAALKDPKAVEEKKEAGLPLSPPADTVASQPAAAATAEATEIDDSHAASQLSSSPPEKEKEKEPSKKKEKKKRSEEERKARKEKKRRLAEANGTIPMEIRYDSSDENPDTADSPPAEGMTKTATMHGYPTTDPARVYRRCCQLRETPILKKITEQLLDTANWSSATGMVNKLDLTGYWLQHADVVTLGDYLAVVPVREVLLENSNLSDEGLRVILAGMLTVRPPNPGRRRRRPKQRDMEPRGGLVERLVIKNNKFGPDGWKYLSLFLYLCRSLKFLDVSDVAFPRQAATATSQADNNRNLPNGRHMPLGIAEIFSRALAERLAGPATLELLNIGGTEPTMDQLGTIVDGLIKSDVRRLGLAHNHLDGKGAQHLAKFLAAGNCVGLDLSGNHLGRHIESLMESLNGSSPLWALSLSDCNLEPASLCKVLSTLTKLNNFRFIDLSHNHELFTQSPSAVGTLRKYLPKMEPLKRIHLQDMGMSAEQAIAIIEILPEIHNLAHVNLLENTELVKLADARTEEEQEEACALYASLMAGARLSTSLVCIDIDVPGDKSGEIVKAMAKQVVAYCLRNMEAIHDSDISAAAASAMSESQADKDAALLSSKVAGYPDVIAHLVGHDVLEQDDDESNMDGPDEDYVIGGTGVVKALTCCLENRGDDSGRQSVELMRDNDGAGEGQDVDDNVAGGLPTGGKAKEMSKHLLAAARKIRHRLQPALIKARTSPSDEHDLRKLIFLDETLQGIIKRFEDEFPDTREDAPQHPPLQPLTKTTTSSTAATNHTEEQLTACLPADPASDGEADDEAKLIAHPDHDNENERPLSRTSSVLSKILAEEEGRTLRTGHRFRSGFFTQADLGYLATVEDIGAEPSLIRLVNDIAEDIGGELLERVQKKGAINIFKEDRAFVLRCMKEQDGESWDNFIEAQHKARANILVPGTAATEQSASSSSDSVGRLEKADDSAIAD
ncbi:cell wall biogenesis protein Mhp1 [Geosmithia morbida]|uniref:Cell wall biogenesis protein Mhp1 n=1 Tax=Geosmithia morbida TaxID=1094350 RepID=A0A9P5D2Q3_9HYPO|nr:cell wall biogenesis protein Mhp1 [Geosmithia morbida]KAF4121040.1 cell wall biogenesis protein Mhp1 [Geosmithia morbida]